VPRPLAYEEERRLKTGHLVAALALVVLGVLIGWVTDGGDSGGSGQAQSADVGPSRTENGVPVGYERSREGAVAAAVNYDAALARPEFVNEPARRTEILDALATREAARRYQGQDYSSLAQTPVYRATREGKASVWQTTPLGYRVDRYTGDEAHIFAWNMAITGTSETQPLASLGTGTSQLRWEDGDWKFAGDVGQGKDGPTPALLDDAKPTPAAEFRARLRGLEGLRYVP